jgi:hypothetical protein
MKGIEEEKFGCGAHEFFSFSQVRNWGLFILKEEQQLR